MRKSFFVDSDNSQPNHDEPPNSQDEGIPDGHVVHHVGEVHVEPEEHRPTIGILEEKSD